MLAAMVKDGVVVNLIVADAEQDGCPDPDARLINVDEAAPPAIGSTYDDVGGEFTPPVEPEQPVYVPDIISPRQLRLALLRIGLLDDIEAAISSMDRSVQIAWEYATEVRRTDPLLTAIVQSPSLNFSPEQVDQFFITASGL